MSRADAVAVVGMGCVFPGAPNLETFWANVVEGHDAIIEAPPERIDPRFFNGRPGYADHLSSTRGGFVQNDALTFEPGRFGIMPLAVDGAEPDQMMALKTAAAALDDAGELRGVARERIGVVLGRGGYLTSRQARLDQRLRTANQLLDTMTQLLPEVDEDRLLAVKDAFADQLGELRPGGAIDLVPNLAASRIANRLDLGGPAYTIDAACASSLIAIDLAVSELTSGRCDAVLAGGVHHCDDLTLWSVFSQLGALSASGEIRPFSRHADGVLASEGTGILVLERLEDAARRDHRVYATVTGAGVASDGRQSSLMNPLVAGQVLALERAYRAAGVDPSTVALLEGHGTATPTGDKAELETIRRIYGPRGAVAGPDSVLGSVKSNIGHAMPAAGAAGLIKAVMAVHEGVLPPTLHADEPHPALAQTRFRLLRAAEPWLHGPGPRRAGVNAFGFGGINAHVIVEQHGLASRARGSKPAAGSVPAVSDGPGFRFDVVVLQGRDAHDLADQLASVSFESDTDRPGAPQGSGPARIAIIDPTPKRIGLAARVLARGQPWRGRSDIWFEPSGLVTEGGRVAFLLPGLEPTALAELSDVAEWFGLGMARTPEGATGIERHCREMFETGRLLHRALGVLGAAPDDVAGHSLGEWTAAFTAELIPAEQADPFLDGLEPGVLELPGVVFVALGCGSDVAAEIIDDLGEVVISHDNCPHQSVICGPETDIAEARRRFAERKILAQELPFRTGFHTPFLAPYLDVVRHHWGRMPLQVPRIPLWSATTCERYPTEGDAVRQLAVDHLLKPVRFRELIERLYTNGTRVFVQLGVGSLTAFVDDTLKDRPQLSISAASPARTGLAQLVRVAAALWVEGVAIDLGQFDSVATEPSTHDVAIRRGPTTQLTMGTPFVHLPDSVALELQSVTANRRPVADPAPGAETNGGHAMPTALRAELDALLADTLDAGESIATALTAAVPVRPRDREGQQAAARPEVSEEVLDVSLKRYPWLADHCFYRQPDGWTDLSDRFPVVPMTTMVELLAGAARRLEPDLTVTCIENVRALRWLPSVPATRAVLTARRTGALEFKTAIEGYARANVHLAASRPPSPVPSASPLRNARASPVGAHALYADHWMFHGPAFQGVREIGDLGDNGVDGAIESLPTPGAWLDNAGQLLAWWLMATSPIDFIALPQSIDRIEYFGPQPPPGETVTTKVRIVDLQPRTLRSDLELIWNGAVVVRITGWVDRRFDSDPPLLLMHREPEHRLVATQTGEGYLAVEERWGDSASRELMARRYLDSGERTIYGALNPHEQRLWLLGRIAAKDAVRNLLWSDGHGPLFPVQVPLTDDGPHAVVVSDGPASGIRVAVAQIAWIGVAAIDASTIHIELVQHGDRNTASARLHEEVSAVAPAAATLRTSLLRSPVEPLVLARADGSPLGQASRKEYVVTRTQPT